MQQGHLINPKAGKANRKVGEGVAVTYVAQSSCPPACLLQGTSCYAEYGPVALHWRKVTRGEAGYPFEVLCDKINELEFDMLRWGVAGDLPGYGNAIDRPGLELLTASIRLRETIAYTHKPVLNRQSPLAAENRAAIADAVEGGFHLNLSANNMANADELAALQLTSVVTVLPLQYQRTSKRVDGKKVWTETMGEYRDRTAHLPKHTPAGRRVAVCPATYSDATCASCRACAHPRPKEVIIGFPAHGTAKRKADEIATEQLAEAA